MVVVGDEDVAGEEDVPSDPDRPRRGDVRHAGDARAVSDDERSVPSAGSPSVSSHEWEPTKTRSPITMRRAPPSRTGRWRTLFLPNTPKPAAHRQRRSALSSARTARRRPAERGRPDRRAATSPSPRRSSRRTRSCDRARRPAIGRKPVHGGADEPPGQRELRRPCEALDVDHVRAEQAGHPEERDSDARAGRDRDRGRRRLTVLQARTCCGSGCGCCGSSGDAR